jgi:hypothetical protein
LKRYKSPGIDQIRAEMIQAGGETLCSEILKLLKSFWNKEELPEQEGVGRILLLYQFIARAIKMTVVITEAYHCYQLYTKFYPISSSQGQVHMQTKLLGIISVRDQLLIRLLHLSDIGEKVGLQ